MELAAILAAPVALYALTVASWVLYLAVMNLARYRDRMHPVAKAHAYALLGFALAVDLVLTVVVGTLLFLDWPRELTLTARLKRYHAEAAGTWRDSVARWICQHLLDQFDPDGDHC